MGHDLRRALLVTAVVGGMTVGGAGAALAVETDGQDRDPLGSVTDRLPTPNDLDEMMGGSSAPSLSGADSPLREINEQVREGAERFPGGGDLAQKLTDVVCALTHDEVELLGYCPEDQIITVVQKQGDHRPGQQKKDEHRDEIQHGDSAAYSDDEHYDDGGRHIPTGGIETGAGGTAGGGHTPAPIGLLAGGALAALGAQLGRRKLGVG